MNQNDEIERLKTELAKLQEEYQTIHIAYNEQAGEIRKLQEQQRVLVEALKSADDYFAYMGYTVRHQQRSKILRVLASIQTQTPPGEGEV